MTSQERNLVIDLAVKRISEPEFLSQFSANPRRDIECVQRALHQALLRQENDDVECALLLGFHFGFGDGCKDVLRDVLMADWHTQHENVVLALQDLKDEEAVECLYQTALKRFAYRHYDESESLAVKCIWALKKLNTPPAIEKLRLLTKSENAVIRQNAIDCLAQKEEI